MLPNSSIVQNAWARSVSALIFPHLGFYDPLQIAVFFVSRARNARIQHGRNAFLAAVIYFCLIQLVLLFQSLEFIILLRHLVLAV